MYITVFLIFSIFKRVFILLLTLLIYSYMLSPFSVTALNILILVTLNSCMIIPMLVLFLSLLLLLKLLLQTFFFFTFLMPSALLLRVEYNVLCNRNYGKWNFIVNFYINLSRSLAVFNVCGSCRDFKFLQYLYLYLLFFRSGFLKYFSSGRVCALQFLQF